MQIYSREIKTTFDACFILSLLLIITACGGEGSLSGLSSASSSGVEGLESGPQSGKSGSLAQFIIKDNYLYSVLDERLKTYSIGNDLKLNFEEEQHLDFRVETIFPFREYLLLGARSGVFIYKTVDNGLPIYVSEFEHVFSCDPVVAQGDYAYLTLREANDCRGEDRFDILDISNIQDPKLVLSKSIESPFGLAVDGDYLFICQGTSGISVFDISNKEEPELIHHSTTTVAKDIILDPAKKIAMFMGYDKLIQWDYSDISSIKEISNYEL